MGVIVIFIFTEIGAGQIRQQIHKVSFCLCHQRIAIGKEQNIFNPSRIKQNMAKFNHCPGFTGSGSHHKQCFPFIFHRKAVTHRFNSRLLIISSGNVFINCDISEARSHGTQIKPFFQISLGINGCTFSFRILSVYDSRIKTIGQEYHRPALILSF